MSAHPSGMLLDENATDTKKPAVHNPLEQFVLLAKGTKGAACTELIKTVLEAPGVYVFAELLAQPNIAELADTPNAHYLNTLNVFAYGTYKQYLDNKSTLIELTDVMQKKLKHLTIVTMAIRNKCISYTDLLEQLDIKNVRELEDLIIESIYADIIHGKLDQKNKQLEVDYAIGRDIRPEDVSKISATLQEWSDSCESVLHTIEIQVDRANAAKAARTKHTEDLEEEIAKLRKTLKTHLSEIEEDFTMDYKESTSSTTSTTLPPLERRINKNKSKAMKPSSGGVGGVKLHR